VGAETIAKSSTGHRQVEQQQRDKGGLAHSVPSNNNPSKAVNTVRQKESKEI